MNWLDRLLNENIITQLQNVEIKDYLRLSYINAEKKSTDKSTWTGSLIVDNGEIISKGSNTFPSNCISTKKRYKIKYLTQDHAERNAIYNAAKKGIPLFNKLMVTPWSPCYPCAVGIIHSGISEIAIHYEMCIKTPENWKNELIDALLMLNEANIKINMYHGKIGNCKNKFRDEIWCP